MCGFLCSIQDFLDTAIQEEVRILKLLSGEVAAAIWSAAHLWNGAEITALQRNL